MTCSVYATKPFPPVILAVSALAAALSRFALHADLWIVAGVFPGIPLLAGFAIILLRKPVVRVDKTGIAYHPRSLPKLGWPEVAGVERAALVEPTVDGLVYHPGDGWRPILVILRDPSKHLRRMPTALQSGLIVDREDTGVCFRIDLTGLSPVSAKVHDCIRHHLNMTKAAGRKSAA